MLGLPIRLVVGLHLLKHIEGLSDEAVCERWERDPYMQYFCGGEYFQHSFPLERSGMTHFRQENAMELWNREELYAEVWERPLIKLAPKYGISAVAHEKVCDKLQIPLPGRGYWTKKEFGKPVDRVPLPRAEDLPLVQRLKLPSSEQAPSTSANS
jgi:hypothetical protein